MSSGPTPWLGLAVTIRKIGHPFCHYPAVVKDVLIGQNTRSGLKIIIEIMSHQAAAPRRQTTVDYDYVLDAQ